MAFDGIMLRAVALELQASLAGGRVNRVFQPEPHEVTLEIYAGGAGHTLLLSCHPRHARAHLTERPRRNPPVPPNFCMLLRKHLEGGRVEAVGQEGLERLLRLDIATVNELGEPVRLTLVAELMGKHSNIILLDGSGLILDALRRLPAGVNRHREVLPGRPCVPPPAQDKIPLVPFDPAALAVRWRPPAAAAQAAADAPGRAATPAPAAAGKPIRAVAGIPAWRRLVDLVEGLGPVNAREALSRAGLDPEATAAGMAPPHLAALGRVLAEMARTVAAGAFTPTARHPGTAQPGCGPAAGPSAVNPDATPPAVPPYSALELTMLPAAERFSDPSPSRLLDLIYTGVEEAERFREERQRLARAAGTHLERLRRRLQAQEEERREAAAAEEYRICGELLTAHLHLLRPGLAEVRVPDWYDPAGGERVIPLDPRLGPAANAQAYFKRYRKGKRARDAVEAKLAQTVDEIRYLEGVEASLEAVETLDELAEVATELAAGGYLKDARPGDHRSRPGGRPRSSGLRPARRGATGAGESLPLAFVSSDGFTILVGKNNRQNDELTMRLAAPGDLWLHAKDIPGSHVVVRLAGDGAPRPPVSSRPPGEGAPRPTTGGGRRLPAGDTVLEAVPPRTLEEAAMLAAYYSKARHSGKTPVDVTWRRHVRKPRGARPGFVVYTDQRTVYVTPDPAAITALQDRSPPARP